MYVMAMKYKHYVIFSIVGKDETFSGAFLSNNKMAHDSEILGVVQETAKMVKIKDEFQYSINNITTVKNK